MILIQHLLIKSLPEPLGPTKATTSPGFTVNETSYIKKEFLNIYYKHLKILFKI